MDVERRGYEPPANGLIDGSNDGLTTGWIPHRRDGRIPSSPQSPSQSRLLPSVRKSCKCDTIRQCKYRKRRRRRPFKVSGFIPPFLMPAGSAGANTILHPFPGRRYRGREERGGEKKYLYFSCRGILYLIGSQSGGYP